MKWIIITVLLLAVYIGYILHDKFEPESVKGKRVLITGASQGIGEQIAYHYARLGAKLVITSRREQRLKEVIEKCREVGDANGDYHYYPADMSNMTATKSLIQFTQDKLGGLDYIILNHILIVPLGEWQGKPENFTLLDKTLDVNFKAYVYLATYALPLLEKSGGNIVVLSSIAGKVSQPYVIAYSASKFALDGFFAGLRQELQMRESRVSITMCIIGLIGTENAVSKLKEFGLTTMFNVLSPAEPSDAAMAIIKGGQLRAREMYFPYMDARLVTLLRDWFPESLAWFNRYLYGKS